MRSEDGGAAGACEITFDIRSVVGKDRRISMQVTDVRVRRVEKEGKMKAVASITFDEEFVIHDIKVIEGEKGLFIAMPSRKTTDGEYRDIAHPIRSSTRELLQSTILRTYRAELDRINGERVL
ncbi:putative negative regulator of asymmetric septation [Oribacterium sp. oral taxon 078 str. F0263]|jgi:Uncharacterized protein, involved in the regulation of septum location|nr:putative stage V sporulation protein G [Oribacterium sp. oral taxon 078 str. F0262]ERL20741.1 putative negative regulator of asymmetric septation [Oribacterium sp. oral taxon 078 str. F0263]